MATGLAVVPARASTAPVAYETTIVGTMPEDLRAFLFEVSQSHAFQDRDVSSPAALRRRVADDEARLLKALRSKGFYDATVSGGVQVDGPSSEAVLAVETGPLYLIEDVVIERTGAPGGPVVEVALTDIGLEMGMAAEAMRLKAAEEALLDVARRSGYPMARIAEARYVVDHDRTTLTSHVLLDPGTPATFGPLAIEGLEAVRERYVRVLADWRVGRSYDPSVLKDLKRRISDTSLFSTIIVETPEAPDVDGVLPVTLRVQERDRRTVGLGLRVTSGDDFLSANASWQNRNYLGGGETLKAETTLSSLEQKAALGFRKPQFIKRGQTFVASAVARHEDSDAFEESSLAATVGLERRAGEIYTTNVGLAAEQASISDSEDDSYFALVGAPIGLTRDSRDAPLDATTGTLFTARVTPWASLSESSSGFVVGELSGAMYRKLGTPRIIAAARARIGSILASDLGDVPANKRFYAGGGSSIRGYEFRRVGPLDGDGNPTGGRAVAEIGAEIRFLATENIGVVPFIDGGQVYKTTLPGFDEDLQWAAGLGLRYITPIGPLRLDVAFPLDRRAGIDDRFQFYVSIGQAF